MRKAGSKKRIGLLYGGSPSEVEDLEKPIWTTIQRLGWIGDENLFVERAFADGDAGVLKHLAETLVSKHVDLILAVGNSAPLAAARATQMIPIVFVNTLLPLERGLIDSYARPGRNATGVALYTDLEVTTKRLDFLKQIVPFATRLSWTALAAYFSLETVSGHPRDMIPTYVRAARQAGFETRFHQVRQDQDLNRLFAEIVASSAQALMAALSGLPPDTVKSYIALALRHRLPTAFFDRGFVKAGGLLSYGLPHAEEQLNGVRCGEYVDRVLLGAAPGSIAVYRPDKYEFVINLNTAKELGLRLPQSLLLRADEVIQ